MNKLSKIEVFSIALGSIIGWGAFMLPGNKFLSEAGIINTFIGLMLGAIAILIIENSYKFMISKHDDEGGEFSYTYKVLGKNHGFISGWFLGLAYLAIVPLNATALPLVIDKVLNGALKVGHLYDINGSGVFLGEIFVSVLVILIFAYINIRGVKKAGKFQSYLTITLVSIVIAIFGLMLFSTPKTIINESYITNYSFDISQIFAIFAITPWAFIGFDAIPQLMNNFDFPKQKASQLSVLSIIFGLIIYTFLNIVTGMVYSPETLVNTNWATGEAVLSILGYVPFLGLALALFLAVCSGVNGFFVSTTKLLSSMSSHKVLPFDVSINSNKIINFITVISLIAPWFGREALTAVVDMASVGAAIAYGYVCYIAFKNAIQRKDKILGFIGLVISIIFVGLLILPNSPAALGPASIVALIIWIILGFWYYRKTVLEQFSRNVLVK